MGFLSFLKDTVLVAVTTLAATIITLAIFAGGIFAVTKILECF